MTTMPFSVSIESLLNEIHDGICAVTKDYRICYWNRAAEEITGFKAKEVVGRDFKNELLKHVDELGREQFRDQSPLAAAIESGKFHTATVHMRHKNGYRFPVVSKIVPLEHHSENEPAAVEIFSPVLFEGGPRQRQAELENLSLLNPMTRLPNRNYLESQLHVSLDMMKRTSLPFGVLMFKVDHFQGIQDEFGEERAKNALSTAALALAKAVRPADIVGQWGDGPVFLGIFQLFSWEDLERVGRRCGMLVSQSRVETGKCLLAITFSIGGTMANASDSITTLVEHAEALMRKSSFAGGNTTTIAGK